MMENKREDLSPELFEKILNDIEEAIMLIDGQFRIIWANKKLISLSGFKGEDVVGNFCYKVTHNLQGPCCGELEPCPINDIIKTSKPRHFIHAHFDKEGSKIYVEVSAYPIEGKKIFMHVARDITVKVKLEEKIKEQERIINITVGRELMMVELKNKIKELKEKLNK